MKKRILLLAIDVFRVLYNAFYALMKLQPVQKKVVMMSRQSNAVRPDFLQLAAALHERGAGLSVVFLCREIGPGFAEKLAYGAHLLRCAFHLASARVCVVDGYEIPVSMLRHRPSLFVLQVWHSLGAVKKFGLQSVSKSAGRDRDIAEKMSMHKHYDCVLAASRHTAAIYAEAFGVPRGKVAVLGIPRVDAILKLDPAKCRAKLLKAYPALAGKRIVLYAPTFRRGALPETEPLVRAASRAGFALVTRLHPLDLEKIGDGASRLLTCPELGTFTLMAAADDVITDYSAISIEASLLLRHVWFYLPDIREYERAQGLNFDPLREMPGCAFKNADALADAMLRGEYDEERLRAFRDLHVETRDTGCTARIADCILALLAGEAKP